MYHQEGLWVRMIGWRHLETNPVTTKPETVSHMVEQFSWFPLPYCSLPWCPFPIKSLALSARESSWTTHFQVLDKSPLSGPGRRPPSCNMRTETLFDMCSISVPEMKLCNYLLLVTDGIGILCSKAVGSSKNPLREKIWHEMSGAYLVHLMEIESCLPLTVLLLTLDNLLFWGNCLLSRCTYTWKN